MDGVRYDVPAVQYQDGELASITLRTPIPKSDPLGSWSTINEPFLEDNVEGWQVQDNSHITSQWLVQVDVGQPIPVDPPFTHETYRMVDDTDVQLWEQGPGNAQPNFPYGPAEGNLSEDGTGLPMWPHGADFLTMESPPAGWIDFFDAVSTGYKDDGMTYADNMPQRFAEAPGINHGAWLPGTQGVHQFDVTKATFYWVQEWSEGRYSKNILELPGTGEQEGEFVADDSSTLPDLFTEFVLPDRPNPASEYFADLAFDAPCSRMDVIPGGENPEDCQAVVKLMGGDYHVTTSFTLAGTGVRHAFTHDPRMEDDVLHRYDLYFNEVDIVGQIAPDRPVVADTAVRLYGQKDVPPPETYSDPSDPFDPTVLPRDSATFNPAILLHTDPDFIGGEELLPIRACSEDANLKKYLRMWYEPAHTYDGPRVQPQASRADTITVESTYLMVDAATLQPRTACAETTEFPFATEGVHLEPGDGHAQPGLDTMTMVRLGDVSAGTSMAGTVEIERRVTLDVDESLQFFDHKVDFLGVVNTPSPAAQLRISYLGNTLADAPQVHEVTSRIYLDRSNNDHAAPAHGDPAHTWYVELVSYSPTTGEATFIVGKELSAGDAFYVDGVRYDVPAIRTVDGELSYLTLRTPLPKSDPEGTWTSVPEALLEEELDGQWQVMDNSHVTSQWLIQIDNKDPIPVDPPFNHPVYRMVDDIDVQLWEQGAANTVSNFPWGPPAPSLGDGTGLPAFPDGERYLTMLDPPQAWIDTFGAVPTGYLDSGATYADSMPQRYALATGINNDAWRDGTTGPQSFAEGNVNLYWVKEWFEDRYTTNLIEIPEEGAFVGDEINSTPLAFTTFVLPDRPNPASHVVAELAIGDDPDCTRFDLVDLDTCSRTVLLLGGDYMITSSLELEPDLQDGDDGVARLMFTHRPFQFPPDAPGVYLEDRGLYINEFDASLLIPIGGAPAPSPPPTSSQHPYDTLAPACVFSDDEVLVLVADWAQDLATDDLVLTGVAAWALAPDPYCTV